ncbi:MAG TPA: hypothetical protein VGD98_17865, partial [Ktedonobacteraceae bacterium]
ALLEKGRGLAGAERPPNLCLSPTKQTACRLVFLAGLWYTFNGRIELIFKTYAISTPAFTSVDADRSGDK